MKKMTKLMMMLLMSLVFASFSNESEKALLDDTAKAMEELTKIFEGITDKKTAGEANPKILAVGKKLKAIEVRAKALNLDTKDPKAQEALKKKYKAEVEKIEAAGKKMMGAMMKVMMNPDLSKEIQEAMKSLN